MTRISIKLIGCKQALLAGLVGSQLLLSGCGGTSQDDMRRHAIRRTPDKDEADSPTPDPRVAASPDAQPKVAASAAKPTLDPVAVGPVASAPAGSTIASQPSSQPANTAKGEASTTRAATPLEATASETPPIEPLSPGERRQRAASNMTRIGEAWRAYLNDKGGFPGPITGDTKQPLLSWRVELLPYLGLQSTYDAFHRDEAWDSPHNIALLDQIPEVFQSPERFDTNTNYLALSQGGSTVYQERRRVSQSKVEDGIENTLAVVEVDEEHAVSWTKPAEFTPTAAAPLQSLGKLRENGLFVIWSDGKPSWIDGSVDPKLFAKACTIDSGDGFRGSQIASELAAGIEVPVAAPEASAEQEMVAAAPEVQAVDAPAAPVEKRRRTLSDAQASLQAGKDAKSPPFHKQPIPPASELKVSRDLLRELYQADYAAANTIPQRSQLARKMLERMPDLGSDVAGQYALLEIVTQIAIQAGSVDVAVDAADQMLARFELKGDLLLDTLEQLARTARDRQALERLLEEAGTLFDEFATAEKFELAERLSQLATAAANKVGDRTAVHKFTTRRSWASEAQRLHKAAAEGLATLEEHPEDARANGDVGKFLCLIKGDWDNGLVILANGHDRSLKRLAEMELDDAGDAMQQLELADLWWREAETELPAFKATLQSRAKYWYEQSLPGLPAGLVRIRVERRLEELDEPSA
ncbi:MAG: DUF1559 domain-containing protein [Pirellulaceae bacterium]